MEQHAPTWLNEGNEELIKKWSDVIKIEGKGEKKLAGAPKISEDRFGMVANIFENCIGKKGEGLMESSLQADADYYDKILIPMLRRSVPVIVGTELFGTQPMAGPTGLIFSLRSTYQNDDTNTLKRPASNSIIASLVDASAFTVGGAISSTADAYVGVIRLIEGNNLLIDTTSGTLVVGVDVDNVASFSSSETTVAAVEDNEIAFPIVFSNYTGPVATATAEAYSADMKQVGIEIDKTTVTAKSRKLKAKWTIELEQDLQAVHGINANSLLTQVATSEIINEINKEHLDLVSAYATTGGATAFNYSSVDGRWEREKYENLRASINRQKLAIASANKRGSATFMVVSPNVLAALESSGQISQEGVDVAASPFRGMYQGMKVYVNLFATSDFVDLGYKGGNNEMDAGAFYCPYKPIEVQKGYGENDGQPRLFFNTRYATQTNPYGVANYFRKLTVTNLPS